MAAFILSIFCALAARSQVDRPPPRRRTLLSEVRLRPSRAAPAHARAAHECAPHIQYVTELRSQTNESAALARGRAERRDTQPMGRRVARTPRPITGQMPKITPPLVQHPKSKDSSGLSIEESARFVSVV